MLHGDMTKKPWYAQELTSQGHALRERRITADSSNILGSVSVSQADASDKISSFSGSRYSFSRPERGFKWPASLVAKGGRAGPFQWQPTQLH
jgi:hypothetical protein